MERTVPSCSPAPTAPGVTPPPPNPPATMFGIERFMASAIRPVRIDPEAPTIIPATISAGLLRATPVAPVASPVKAFRSEITTGMSAPPMGSTIELPSSAAATSSPMMRIALCEPATMTTASAMAAAKSAKLTTCWGRPSVIGRPGRISWSLPNAMFEPQNDTEPTMAANSEKTAT